MEERGEQVRKEDHKDIICIAEATYNEYKESLNQLSKTLANMVRLWIAWES